MMKLNDWQQRVVDEAEELGKKIIALDEFLYGPKSKGIKEIERGDLNYQGRYMRQYYETLIVRIKKFVRLDDGQ